MIYGGRVDNDMCTRRASEHRHITRSVYVNHLPHTAPPTQIYLTHTAAAFLSSHPRRWTNGGPVCKVGVHALRQIYILSMPSSHPPPTVQLRLRTRSHFTLILVCWNLEHILACTYSVYSCE